MNDTMASTMTSTTASGTISTMEVLVAQPRGFCAGVERAIGMVERALALHGSPIYVQHEIVHNQ